MEPMSIKYARQGSRSLTIAVCDRCSMEAELPFRLDAASMRDGTTTTLLWWTDDKDRDLCADCYLIHGTGEGGEPIGILNT